MVILCRINSLPRNSPLYAVTLGEYVVCVEGILETGPRPPAAQFPKRYLGLLWRGSAKTSPGNEERRIYEAESDPFDAEFIADSASRCHSVGFSRKFASVLAPV